MKHRIHLMTAIAAVSLAAPVFGQTTPDLPPGRLTPQAAAQAAGVELPPQDHAYRLGGVPGSTEQGRPFISGGVSIEEARAMEAARDDYRLWLITADRNSGAWLAGARTVIRDARGNEVLDTIVEGPYLLVDLAPGRYEVHTTLDGKSSTRSVQVDGSGTQRVIASFDTDARVSPDMPERGIAPIGAESALELNNATAD